MNKLLIMTAAALGLLLVPTRQLDDRELSDCIERCKVPASQEVFRQEIVSLEKEAARAIQLRNGTFFRRVYGDDFAGTLSHGQQVSRAEWIAAIETSGVKYDSFNASDVKVQIYQNTAVATSLWSARGVFRGQRISRQMRVTHVYLNTMNGWRVMCGQITSLPPDVEGAL